MLPLSNYSPDEDPHNSSPSPVSQLLEELSLDCSFTDYTPDSSVMNGSYFLLNGKANVEWRDSLPSPQQSSQSSPVKQKPPAVSKKPKISFLPPFNSQPMNEQLPSQHEEDQVDAPQTRQIKEEEKESRSEKEEEETSESSEPFAESSETSTVSQDESHISAFASQETSPDHGPRSNGEAHEEDEEEEEGDGTSSTTGSISSKEDDTGESEYKKRWLQMLSVKTFIYLLVNPITIILYSRSCVGSTSGSCEIHFAL